MSDVVAIVLAAGMGTRMKSALPKALHPVLGRPMLTYPIDAALGAGASRVVLVLGHCRDEIESAMRRYYPDAPLEVAVQAEQKGTGHAVLCALPSVPAGASHVLVLNGDLPNLGAATVSALVEKAVAGVSPVGILTAQMDSPGGYGRIIRDGQGRVLRITEQADASAEELAVGEVNVGTYIFEAEFLRRTIQSLETNNAQDELYLTDLIARSGANGAHACSHVTHDQDEVCGVNNRADLARAERIARARRNHGLMLAGVTMLDPDHTYVGPDVEVAADVLLWPGVTLLGDTRVESGVEVRTGAIVIDAILAQGTLIRAYSHIEGAVIGRDCVVGPFGRLRPATELSAKAKVGNFVEIKKSQVGEGSKVNHLTYVGDATIGAGVNVGAGTITCNYDGKNKHPTVIGDGAFIGSNTELVAPVEVGAGAVIGAGSTITEDVPSGALGLGRARQRNIADYANRKTEE